MFTGVTWARYAAKTLTIQRLFCAIENKNSNHFESIDYCKNKTRLLETLQCTSNAGSLPWLPKGLVYHYCTSFACLGLKTLNWSQNRLYGFAGGQSCKEIYIHQVRRWIFGCCHVDVTFFSSNLIFDDQQGYKYKNMILWDFLEGGLFHLPGRALDRPVWNLMLEHHQQADQWTQSWKYFLL